MSRRFGGLGLITIASGYSLTTSGGWTACSWVRVVSADSSGTIDANVFYGRQTSYGDYAPSHSIALNLAGTASSPTAAFIAGNASTAFTYSQGISLNTWTHLALTYDGSTVKAYIDGTQVSSSSMTMSLVPNEFTIGDFSQYSGGFGTFETAQTKVWQGVALSAAQLADEISYWTPQSSTGSVWAWWQLENASPTADSSGNSRPLPSPAGSTGSFTPPGSLAPSGPAISGAATSSSTLSGALRVNKALSGAATSSSTLSGALRVNKALSGAATSASTLTGTLSQTQPLAAGATSASTLAGTLSQAQPLTAAATSASALAGSLTVTSGGATQLEAAASTLSTLAGWLRPRWGRRIIDTASSNITRSMAVSKGTPWTLMTWFRTVDSSDEIRVGFIANAVTVGSNSGNLRLRLLDDSATFVINYSGSDDLQWHHLALTFDGTTARGYVDGTQVASSAASFSGSFVSISWDSLGGSAAADVTHTKLWSGVALSAAEIDSEADYYQPHTSTWALVAWWQLAWNAVTFDSSGNGYTLTDNGSTEAQTEAPGLPLTDLAGGATTASTLAGTLSQAQPLLGGASSASTLAGTLSQTQPLVAGATTASTLAGTLSQTQPLTGAAVSASTLAGTLSQAQPLVGGASTASTLSGNLFVSVPLAAGATTASSLAGTLGLAIPIAGALSTGSTLAGALGIEGAFSGNALTASTLSGTLSVDKPIAGAAATASTLAGILSQLQPLGAALSTGSTLDGTLTIINQCEGGASTASTLSGSLSVAVALSSAAATASTLSGDLSITKQIAAALQTASNLTGALTVQKQLVGAATTTSHLTGTLDVPTGWPLSAAARTASTLAGTLDVDIIWPLAVAASTASTLSGSLTVTVPASAHGRVVTSGNAKAYYGPATIVTPGIRHRRWPPKPS